MRRVVGLISISVLALVAESSSLQAFDFKKELRDLQKQQNALDTDAAELQTSVLSLDQTQQSLMRELLAFESRLSQRMSRSILPLMSWPSEKISLRAKTWVEHQRAIFLVGELKAQVLREPLDLVAERERRINEIQQLREQLRQKLAQLQMKRSLIDFQVEELEMIRQRSEVDLPQASGRTKRVSN